MEICCEIAFQNVGRWLYTLFMSNLFSLFKSSSNTTSMHFVVDNSISAQTVQPLIIEAKRIGLRTTMSDRNDVDADIGYYLEDRATPGSQSFTVRTINGLDQDHTFRPNYADFFSRENWDQFDMGLLPGPRWMRGFESQFSRPRLGVFEVGWAKSDPFLPLKPGNTVVLAAQVSTFEKIEQVINAIAPIQKEFSLKLKIKTWESREYQSIYPWLVTDELLQGIASAKEILPSWASFASPRQNFMECLQGAGLLITDQSSVLYEALLVPIPSIAVSDWIHACGKCPGPQPSPDAVIATESTSLQKTLKTVLENRSNFVLQAEKLRSDNFVHLGRSSSESINQILTQFELR